MNLKLLSILRCPECHQVFALDVFIGTEDVVEEGLLTCECKNTYPIINGIPRILPNAYEQNPLFVQKYYPQLENKSRVLATKIEKFNQLHSRTSASFGKQWLTFDVVDLDDDRAVFISKTGFNIEDLEERWILDAGCGSGRYTRIVGQAGAEVVAIDLSQAVEKTSELTSKMPNVHIVQGDLLALPFRQGIFDYIYSIGVLHHTPDTKKSFQAIVPLLKPGGVIAIWLYRKRGLVFETVNAILRAVSTKMPLSLLHRLAYLAIPLGWLKRKLLQAPAPVNWLSWLLPNVSSHPNRQVRVCDTFDWYAPKYQWHHTDLEVKAWFEEMGLQKIQSLPDGAESGVNMRGVKPAF